MTNYWPLSITNVDNLFLRLTWNYDFDQFCNKNSAIYFQNKSYASVKNTELNLNYFTLSAWVKLKSYGSNSIFSIYGLDIITFDFGDSGTIVRLFIRMNSKLSVIQTLPSIYSVKINKWFLATFTYFDSIGSIYINGGLVVTKLLNDITNINITNYFIAKPNIDSNLSLTQIKLYDGALKTASILNDYVKSKSFYQSIADIIIQVSSGVLCYVNM